MDSGGDAVDTETALSSALTKAEELGREFDERHSSDDLRPRLGSLLTSGTEGQPLIVFSLAVSVDPGVAGKEYPVAEIDSLVTQARELIEGTEIDDWDWLVQANLADAAVALD